MTRSKKVEIRLTDEEAMLLENLCSTSSMTKSEYIRHLIKNRQPINVKSIGLHVFTMQTLINTMNQFGVTQENMNALSREVSYLWQYLN